MFVMASTVKRFDAHCSSVVGGVVAVIDVCCLGTSDKQAVGVIGNFKVKVKDPVSKLLSMAQVGF